MPSKSPKSTYPQFEYIADASELPSSIDEAAVTSALETLGSFLTEEDIPNPFYRQQFLVSRTFSFSLSFVSVEEMARLNSTFRKVDGATDVLSFPQGEGLEFPIVQLENDSPQSGSISIGDVVICPMVASQNASDAGCSEKEELIRLVIHSVLHLMGWDHTSTSASEPMLDLQERIIKDIEF